MSCHCFSLGGSKYTSLPNVFYLCPWPLVASWKKFGQKALSSCQAPSQGGPSLVRREGEENEEILEEKWGPRESSASLEFSR